MEVKNSFYGRYKTYLYYGLLGLAAVTMISVRFGKRKQRNEADYVAATHAFQKWDQVLDTENEGLKDLEKMLKKHPELSARYEAQIGQNLLAAYSPEQAKPYVESTLKRTAQPYYSSYAQTSVTVSSGEYAQALEEALKLKEEMLADEAFWEKAGESKNYGSALFAFNLMRIAALHGELGNQRDELNAWKELKRYGGWDAAASGNEKIGKEGFKQLLTHFTVQESSLLDYIEAREQQLSSHQ